MSSRETVFLLAALVLVVGGVVAYWLSRPAPSPGEASPFFYQVDSGSINHVTIAVGSTQQAFKWDEESQAWEFDDATGEAVDTNRWGGMPVVLSGPRIVRSIPDVTDLAQYGLNPPKAVVTIGLDDGRQVVVWIGSTTPDGQAHYLMQPGTQTVVLVDSSWGNVIESMVTNPPRLGSATPTPTP